MSRQSLHQSVSNVRFWGLPLLSFIELTANNLEFNLDPLVDGYVYSGPTAANANPCRCSSVYYSMLSACAYCQGQKYLRWISFRTFSFIVKYVPLPSWSEYRPNCSTVYVGVWALNYLSCCIHWLSFSLSYNYEIPVGVKVPAYAYQNVSVLYSDMGKSCR